MPNFLQFRFRQEARSTQSGLINFAKVPVVVTGTAVGLVSVIGYTPDIFVSLVQGVLLDNAPGLPGHQHFFMFLAIFGAIGLIVSIIFTRVAAQTAHTQEQAT